MVKRLPAMQEIQVRSLGLEDPLEKEMATHSSTLAWKIPWTEEPSRLQPMGSLGVAHDWATSFHFSVCVTVFRSIHVAAKGAVCSFIWPSNHPED